MVRERLANFLFNKKLWMLFQLFFMLVRDYQSGNFRKITLNKVIILCVGIIYIISPIDLIPDILIGLGWLDDIAFAIYIAKILRHEILLYCKINNITYFSDFSEKFLE